MRHGHRTENSEQASTHPHDDDTYACLSLWAAVLKASIHDAWFGDEYTKSKAAGWFKSNVLEPGGFVWVCQALGIDEDCIRRRVGITTG